MEEIKDDSNRIIDTDALERETRMRDLRYRIENHHAITLSDMEFLMSNDEEGYRRLWDSLAKETPKEVQAEPTVTFKPVVHENNPMQGYIDEIVRSVQANAVPGDLLDGYEAAQVTHLMEEEPQKETPQEVRYQFFTSREQESVLNARV